MLEIIDVSFDYGETALLQHINLTLPLGTCLHLQGKNGSGKTTLLKLIAGLLIPTQGHIQYQGRSIVKNILDYQQNISYLGHKAGVSPGLTLKEHCSFELCVDPQASNLTHLLTLLSLAAYWLTPLYLLSAGLLRKVGLLRVLLSKTTLWLLDEPLVALDNAAVDVLLSAMHGHLQQGGQIIVISHQIINLTGREFNKYELCT